MSEEPGRHACRRLTGCAAAGVAALLFLLASPGAALAIRDIKVTTTQDTSAPADGQTSLREAFSIANSSDEEADIVLAASRNYILSACAAGDDDANAVGDLDHFANGGLTVSGNRSTIRQTCPGARVVDQRGSGFLNLADVTITGGDASTAPGGGVFNEGAGELDLKNAIVTGNHSGAAGGGVASLGASVLTGTTLTLNTADELAGGIAGIGPTKLIRSTVTGNQSRKMIGGVAASNGLTMVYATVQDNSATNIDVQAGGLTTFGSVVGIPQHGVGASCSVVGGTTSLGYNFSNDGTCGLGSGAGDRSKGGDPKLRPQQGVGGSLIIEPRPGSPLIDAIPRSACNPRSLARLLPSYAQVTSDQRGVRRPAGKGCDIGAIEVSAQGSAVRPLQLAGSPGRDVLEGTKLGDELYGLAGRDVLTGRRGNDYLDGGPGADRISGGPGDDRIVGGLGRDTIHGGPGDDRIYDVDGERDVIFCGRGVDTVWADRRDRVVGCEHRRYVSSGTGIDAVRFVGAAARGRPVLAARR